MRVKEINEVSDAAKNGDDVTYVQGLYATTQGCFKVRLRSMLINYQWAEIGCSYR